MKTILHMIIPALAFIFCLQSPLYASQQQDKEMPVTTLIQQVRQNKSPFLVDIRPKKEYSQFKIPGSLNIPASLIKTKTFLKTGPMVLIHQGVAHTDLIVLAKDLSKKGFKASVLEGGLAAWKHKQGPIVGNPFSIRQMNTITPKALFAGQSKEDWLVMDFSEKPGKTHQIPQAVAIKPVNPVEKKEDPIVPALRSHKLKETSAIIIFNETGQNYEDIKERFPKPFRHKIYTLTGGQSAYDKFMTSHLLANRSKSQRTKTSGQCEPCSKKTAQ